MSSKASPHSRLPTGTVTFLFTDIEGSTTLWEQFPNAMHEAIARHNGLLRRAIESSGGCIVKDMGDGVYAVFAAAANALAASLAAQRALQAREGDAANPEPALSDSLPTTALRVRMGLHTGVAQIRDGDYFGTPLNRAARVMSAAHGGQIFVSAATAGLVSVLGLGGTGKTRLVTRDRIPNWVSRSRLSDATRQSRLP
jgi:class 3 adenylate cyclase